MTEPELIIPGTPEAKEKGCKCRTNGILFFIEEHCPVHGSDEPDADLEEMETE